MDDRRLKEKLSGRVRYPQDVSSKSLMHLHVLYSEISHGELKGFDLPELPDEVFFLTSKDIPGKNWLDFGEGGMPLLAEGEIRYKGQPLAVLCGPQLGELSVLAGKIQIKISDLPVLKDLDIQDNSEIVYERIIKEGSAEEIFQKKTSLVLEDFFESSEQYHFSFPTPYSSCQKEGPRFIVHTITQWPWNLQKNICSLLKLRKDQVQIKTYPCENSQDSKLFVPAISAGLVALACFHNKRTSTLTPYPTDGLFQSRGRGKVQYYLKAASNAQGDLIALKVDFSFDTGAWPIWAKEWIDRICFSATASYHCRNVEIHGKAQRTNQPPVGQFPDSALGSIFSAVELLTESLARLSETDLLNWKERNILKKGNGFYTGALLTKEPRLERLLSKVVEASDFKRKFSAYHYQASQETRDSSGIGNRGIGISTAYLPSGFLGNHSELYGASVHMRLDQDGSLSIELPFLPGQKQLFKHWSVTASEMLNLEEKNISFHLPTRPPAGGPATLGRNVTVVNQLIINALQWINKRRFRDPLPIEVTRRYRKNTSKWDDNQFSGMPFQYFSWGAMSLELIRDEETHAISVTQIHIAIDSGQLLLPDLAPSIVERGLRQAHSWITQNPDIPRIQYPGFRDRIPYNIHWQESSGPTRSLDGLVQILYPGAFLQALSQATHKSQHSIPPEISYRSKE